MEKEIAANQLLVDEMKSRCESAAIQKWSFSADLRCCDVKVVDESTGKSRLQKVRPTFDQNSGKDCAVVRERLRDVELALYRQGIFRRTSGQGVRV